MNRFLQLGRDQDKLFSWSSPNEFQITRTPFSGRNATLAKTMLPPIKLGIIGRLTSVTALMGPKEDEIIIKLSKTKAVLLTIGAFGFIVVVIWLWATENSQTRYDHLIIKLLLLNSFVFFGLCGCYGFAKIFDNRPGLIINSTGIFDNSSTTGMILIKWADITGLRIESVKNTKFILVFVTNPTVYIDSTNRFKRFWMRLNYKIYGTPLSITTTTLKCNINDLVDLMDQQRRKHSA